MDEKIKVRITGVNFDYNDEGEMNKVNVNFTLSDPLQQMYGNGTLPVSGEDYANSTIASLGSLVADKLIARLQA
jgi:hypothetical protein